MTSKVYSATSERFPDCTCHLEPAFTALEHDDYGTGDSYILDCEGEEVCHLPFAHMKYARLIAAALNAYSDNPACVACVGYADTGVTCHSRGTQ